MPNCLKVDLTAADTKLPMGGINSLSSDDPSAQSSPLYDKNKWYSRLKLLTNYHKNVAPVTYATEFDNCNYVFILLHNLSLAIMKLNLWV